MYGCFIDRADGMNVLWCIGNWACLERRLIFLLFSLCGIIQLRLIFGFMFSFVSRPLERHPKLTVLETVCPSEKAIQLLCYRLLWMILIRWEGNLWRSPKSRDKMIISNCGIPNCISDVFGSTYKKVANTTESRYRLTERVISGKCSKISCKSLQCSRYIPQKTYTYTK